MQFIKFAVVGGINTLVDLAVLNFLFFAFGREEAGWYVVCKVIAFLAAVTNSYILNRRFVFNSSDAHVYREGSLFLLVSVTGLIINVAVSGMAYQVLTITTASLTPVLAVNLSAVIGTGAVLASNYLGYSKLVFNRK